jgi:protein SCO1/2
MATTNRKKWKENSVIVLAAILTIAGGSYAAYQAMVPEEVKASSHLAAFALQDTQGKAFDYQRLAGKPVAVFFGFTRCPDVCPMTLQRLARMREKIGASFDEIEVIFVTLDPERDTAELLRDYMSVQPMKVTALTGSQAAIARTADSFGVFQERVATSDNDYTIDHTASLFLIGRHGGKAGEIPIDATEVEFESKLRSLL